MDMFKAAASFTPEQLQFIGTLFTAYGVGFIIAVWKVARWSSKIENDVNNIGFIAGTKKGIAIREKKLNKEKKK